ncbi:mannose-6-phosphate isomerase ManA [Spirochaetota bacterium]|nr:mannose-6-phosphate isomerase ManA [Spirochaetota bacterium]
MPPAKKVHSNSSYLPAPLWKLKPHRSQKIWGTERWLFSIHPNGASTVDGGLFNGKTLAAAIEEFNAAQPHSPAIPLPPILVKIIQTHEALSVQVHPNNAYARRHENSYGKSECWFFIDHEPQATVISGFRTALRRQKKNENMHPSPFKDTRNTFPHTQSPQIPQNPKNTEDTENTENNDANNDIRQLFLSGDKKAIEKELRYLKVETGASLYIPAGTIHAIGKGITLLEVQQSSDITYRLYDYGRDRETHLEKSLAVLDRNATGIHYPPASYKKIATPYFTIEPQTLKKGEQQPFTFSPPLANQTTILVVLTGALKISTPSSPIDEKNSSENTSAKTRHFTTISTEHPSSEHSNTIIAEHEDCLYAPNGGHFLLESPNETTSYVKIEAFLSPSASSETSY